jgi:hypothetical protein|tara:strand:+ start:376 stop:744 length:369 start_codon:yes stop_codon:yes gene_type:complete
MIVRLKNSMGIEFELTPETPSKAFHQIACLHGVFAHEPCGVCGKDDIVFDSRKAGQGRYYAKRCQGCGAQLDIGQNQDEVNIYIKRPEEHKETSGWYKWQRERAKATNGAPQEQQQTEESPF